MVSKHREGHSGEQAERKRKSELCIRSFRKIWRNLSSKFRLLTGCTLRVSSQENKETKKSDSRIQVWNRGRRCTKMYRRANRSPCVKCWRSNAQISVRGMRWQEPVTTTWRFCRIPGSCIVINWCVEWKRNGLVRREGHSDVRQSGDWRTYPYAGEYRSWRVVSFDGGSSWRITITHHFTTLQVYSGPLPSHSPPEQSDIASGSSTPS